jgi:hypothetical protein
VARSRFWFTAAIGFAALLAITACTSDYESIIAETEAKNMAVIHQSAERQMALLREQHEYENRLLACITAAGGLQIGVATEKDLPCRSVDYPRINLMTTAAGSTAQYVYDGPNGHAAYLYFDENGKLVAKQLF